MENTKLQEQILELHETLEYSNKIIDKFQKSDFFEVVLNVDILNELRTDLANAIIETVKLIYKEKIDSSSIKKLRKLRKRLETRYWAVTSTVNFISGDSNE